MMDATHFGLKRRPFRSTPDSESYYPATGHESALDRLFQAFEDGEGLVLLSGEAGTGKTLLCHRLLEKLGNDPPASSLRKGGLGEVACAFLTNSHVPDRAGLLQAILYDLALPHEQRSEQELRLALTDHLLKTFAAGTRTLVLIDEAQNLGADLLEELRLLSNLETRHGKAVQIMLSAQPALSGLLRRPELAGFSQRLAVRACLEPLGLQEAVDYLVHQLRLAGGRPSRIIADEALEILARTTRGVPRVLNQAAHQALALAQQAGAHLVDVEVVMEALALLGLEVETPAETTADLAVLAEPDEAYLDGEHGTFMPIPEGGRRVVAEPIEEECRTVTPPRRPA